MSVRTARVLAVLALLAGLLGMHGLAGGHAAVPAGAAAVAGHVHAAVPDLPAAPGHDCDEPCQAVTALCLAVLAGAVAAALLLRPRPVSLPAAARRAPPPLPLSALPRSRDPVRELCVSRT